MKALQVLSKNEDSKKLLRSLKRKNEDKDNIPEKRKFTEGVTQPDLNINIVKTWIIEQFIPETVTNLVMTFMVS